MASRLAFRIDTDNVENHKKNKMYGKGKIGASVAIASLLVSSLFTIAGNMAHQSATAVTAVPPGFSTNNDFTNPPNPQLVVEDSDIIHVVWQGFDSDVGTNNVTFAKSIDGGANFDVQVFDSAPDSVANPPDPQLAIDGSNVYLVWLQNSTIVLATSDDGGASFDVSTMAEADDLANPQIAVNGSNIYIVWEQQDEGDILLAKSTDGGSAFNITTVNSGDSSNPQIAVDISSDNVFVVWQANEDIFLAKSEDSGANFDINNLNNTSEASTLPDVFVSGDNVAVAWQETDSTISPPANDIFLARSDDSGANFDILNLSNTPQESGSPSIGSSSDGSDVFVIWEEFSFVTLAGEMFVVASTDGGATLGCPTKVGSTADDAANPGIAADDSNTVYAVWEDVNLDTFASDIAFTDNLEYQTTSVSIKLESDNPDTDFDGVVESRWGLESDAVTVSGSIANAEVDDTVLVDWGDGVSSNATSISLSSCSWTPVSHVYDSEAAALGIASITASLLDGGTGDVKATTIIPLSVAVRAHATLLDLNSIPSTVQGNNVTVSGLLVDTDAEEPIGGASIVLDGSGTDTGLSALSIVTDVDGSFTATAPSPSESASSWLVQAHFAGDILYQPFDSEIRFYSTVNVNATEFPVSSAGENVSVSLSGFGATLEFGNIDSLGAGIVYVTGCNATDTARFAVLVPDGGGGEQTTCLEISPAVQLALGSTSILTMSYGNSSLPDNNGSDIDMFYEQDAGSATYVDITTSRSVDEETVTGQVTSFGKFIVAAAIHSEKLPDEVRQQIFVGEDNTVELRDVDDPTNDTANISLDKAAYRLIDTATITIIDNNANLDPAIIDTVSAGITSETSGADGGINVTLAETNTDTGTFAATFTFTTVNSSGTTLEVANGDSLSVSYEQTLGGKLKAVIDGVVEAGVVDLSGFVVQEDSTPFSPLGYAVNLELVDTNLDPITGVLTITLSYANADLAGSDERFIRMFQGENMGDGTANWNSVPITETDSDGFTIGLDADAKTITSETSLPGVFLLGYDLGSPGGAGGGLGGFGSGLVVDFVASLAQPSGGGGGGSSSNNIPTTSNEVVSSSTEVVLSGTDVESTFDIQSLDQVLELQFENVVVQGNVIINENKPSEVNEIFTSTTAYNGSMIVDGTDSETVTNVFDIEPSAGLVHEGMIQVTIPYNESLFSSSGLPEDHVRLLQFNGETWEDKTAVLNVTANTVTGMLSSLSTVVAAVVEDGTFAPQYFESNPLHKVVLTNGTISGTMDGNLVQQVVAGEQLFINATVENVQRTTQPYTLIIQIVDAEGKTVAVDWSTTTGELARAEMKEIRSTWTTTDQTGKFSLMMFIWDGALLSTSDTPPTALSPKLVQDFNVVGRT